MGPIIPYYSYSLALFIHFRNNFGSLFIRYYFFARGCSHEVLSPEMLLILCALLYMANSSGGDQLWELFFYLNESMSIVQVNPNEQGINTSPIQIMLPYPSPQL